MYVRQHTDSHQPSTRIQGEFVSCGCICRLCVLCLSTCSRIHTCPRDWRIRSSLPSDNKWSLLENHMTHEIHAMIGKYTTGLSYHLLEASIIKLAGRRRQTNSKAKFPMQFFSTAQFPCPPWPSATFLAYWWTENKWQGVLKSLWGGNATWVVGKIRATAVQVRVNHVGQPLLLSMG